MAEQPSSFTIRLARGGVATNFTFEEVEKDQQQITEYDGRALIAYLYQNVCWRFWDAMKEEMEYIEKNENVGNLDPEKHWARLAGMVEHECPKCNVTHRLGGMGK